MNAEATHYFSYVMMAVTARKIARMIHADPVAGWEYFDMHAGELDAQEREVFKNAVIDAATALAIQQAS
jgi:hypothetical protein